MYFIRMSVVVERSAEFDKDTYIPGKKNRNSHLNLKGKLHNQIWQLLIDAMHVVKLFWPIVYVDS